MSGHGWDIVARVLVSVLLGGLIGLERELTDHPAGIRTHILVSFGACIFTTLSLFGFPGFPGGDRVAAAVVTGIGFIGGGAILRSKEGLVRGLTTAASLWSCAAIGMIAGVGLFLVGFIVTGIDLLVLELIDWIVDYFAPRVKTRKLTLNITGEYHENLQKDIVAILKENKCNPTILKYRRSEAENNLELTLEARVSARLDVSSLTDRLYALPGLVEVVWE